jgi:hypothetical protein
MTMKSIASCIAATVIAGVDIVGTASTAEAQTQTQTLANCQAALDGQSIQVIAGEVLTLNFSSCPAAVTSALYLSTAQPVQSAFFVDLQGARFIRQFSGGKWSIDGYAVAGVGQPLPVGSYQLYFRISDDFNNVDLYGGSFSVVVTERRVPESTPDPVIQQFGSPVDSSCDAAAPDALNWSGVSGGGWSRSWAQWMNDGIGGAVCTRTLVYSTAASRWVIG